MLHCSGRTVRLSPPNFGEGRCCGGREELPAAASVFSNNVVVISWLMRSVTRQENITNSLFYI